ncbi:thermonuclease family protein [Sulfurimonas sp. C5]|uniref:thermonuclease family protein n=1 Tax=Sulfurimonas sp. C5 TaxID=3036947 RepID=UPI002456C515|nr:thermonuclease family protein [Sulfurimonas sp. C5]MDH4943529.1 thermonuclease family protein [Sulfurimonas sp. C5]
MMKTFLILLILLLNLNAQSLKDIDYGNAIVDEVTSIYDGDTFRANIKDYPKVVGYRMSIRINGIDTPEMKGKCSQEKDLARKAKQVTVSMLRSAKVIELRNIKRGKYFRLLADVYADDVLIADELIKKGYAIRYNGGTKIDWCK